MSPPTMENPPDVDMTIQCDISFISIHDFSTEARILYTSDSIVDVLGYTPEDVVERSCWEFFSPEDIPHAKHLHQRGIETDRAASLVYCRVKAKDGNWIGCECCFTIVHDVVVACTSVYKSTISSQKRAVNAPIVRRLFASSPKDPRYHMITHISPRLRQPYVQTEHEPRAALFLNRFTRTLTIMYATKGLEEVLGIDADELRGKSFYYCIAESCLQDAIKCLESAKANDSIAYMRFRFRDPRNDNAVLHQARRRGDMNTEEEDLSPANSASSSGTPATTPMNADTRPWPGETHGVHEAMFGNAREEESSSHTAPFSSASAEQGSGPPELEAVISCASDGLVVCLRKARPVMPSSITQTSETKYRDGIFAAPWAAEPLLPPLKARSHGLPSVEMASSAGINRDDPPAQVRGPDSEDFMNAIKEQAIFAWALTGINGSVHTHGFGTPTGESMPPHGIPVWSTNGDTDTKMGGEDRADSASADLGHDKNYSGPSTKVFGDPGLEKSQRDKSASRMNG